MASPRVIFVLSNVTFPPREGLHVQSTCLIRALRESGAGVGLITLVRDVDGFERSAFERDVGPLLFLDVLPTRASYPLLLLHNLLVGGLGGRLIRLLRERVSEYPDAVLHLEGIGLAPLLGTLKARRVVMSAVDAWSLRQQRLAQNEGWFKRIALTCYGALSAVVERRFFPLAGAVQVVSESDARYLSALVPTARLRTIPVAMPRFPATSGAVDPRPAGGRRVIFWGDLAVPHLRQGLIWLFEAVLPHLPDDLLRGVEWWVIGRREPDDQLKVACPGARFLLWLDDVDATLRSADVVVLPDASGTGLKNRTLHAMACQVPVIGSAYAFEGIPVEEGQEAFVRSDPKAFAEALVQLLESPELRRSVADRGARFVRERYGLERIRDEWLALYAEIVAMDGRATT
jgi:glycosyltransferase involved in cell wall biosynthesis